jgi:hypothetical protein
MVRKSHTPCKSGWPSAVRGGVQVWPATGIGASNATAITIAGPFVEVKYRRLI